MLNNNEGTANNVTVPNNQKKRKVYYVTDMLWLSKL